MCHGNLKTNCYEYKAFYVDDLCIATQKPEDIVNTLKTKYKLKVKRNYLIIRELIIPMIQVEQWFVN